MFIEEWSPKNCCWHYWNLFSILRWKKRTNGVPLVGIEGIGAGRRDTELETVDRLQEVFIITKVVESGQFGLHLTVGVVGEDI